MPAEAPWWPRMYADILADFGWRESADREAAERLRDRLPQRGAFRHVGTELKHRPRAIVVGCDETLDDLEATDLPEGIVVAADGATARLREIGVLPRVVVTDLDGHPDALQWAARSGASMVVHAHGHNLDRLDLVPDLGPFVAGTYQCTPDPSLAPLHNLGGFTDGDRAAVLCEAYGVKEVVLAAFDLEQGQSHHTHHSDADVKERKLVWAGRVLAGIQARGRTRLTRLPPTGQS